MQRNNKEEIDPNIQYVLNQQIYVDLFREMMMSNMMKINIMTKKMIWKMMKMMMKAKLLML
jgi:hypothetical protein